MTLEFDGKGLSLIFPAYNEEKRIKSVLLTYCNQFPYQEFVVVCNGCKDNTVEIVQELSSKYSQIKVLNYKDKIGKGGAIIEGFKSARGDIIGFVDADESVTPHDVKNMVNAISNVDAVIASRRISESIILVKQPLKRRIASRMFNILVKIIFKLDFKDTQCGAKLFKKNALNNVIGELTTNGFEFDVELLWKLKKKKYRIIEYPITWKHSEGSTFSLWNAPKMFFSLVRVRLWK